MKLGVTSHKKGRGSMFFRSEELKNGAWQFQDAKAKLSEVFNRTEECGQQIVVRNKKCFIILNEENYHKFIGAHRSIMPVFLRCPHPDIDLDLSRSKETLRDIEL